MICRTYFRTLWFAALLFMLARGDSCAVTSAPYKILQNVRNAIIWQEFDPWLMVTEDCATGRICYFYDPVRKSRLYLKEAMPGSWIPLGSAIKWLMYVDYHQSLHRLMAHDVDWHAYYVAAWSMQNQVGCGMSGVKCVYGQYRRDIVGDHYPVDLYQYNVQSGVYLPLCISDSEKSQFAHDGSLIVYRAYLGCGVSKIYGIYFAGGGEFEIAARNGIEPSVCGSIVAWAEQHDGGYDIVAKDIATGELRVIAFTVANPPCPEAGRRSVYWQTVGTSTGLDIQGYDWDTGQYFTVTNAAGDQYRLRVCEDLVTWATGPTNYQTIWAANAAVPVRIVDLRANLVNSNSVTLGWTSPGFSSNPPVAYDLRFRTDGPITDANWAGSTVINCLGLPRPPGQAESFSVVGLTTGVHYFAIRALLKNGEYSQISNSVCAYVGCEELALLKAPDGAYISFTGVVTGVSPTGEVYCQREFGIDAIRAISVSGQTAAVGRLLTATGVLGPDTNYFGPQISSSVFTDLGRAGVTRTIGMSNKWVGGYDPRFGGTSQRYLCSNVWMRAAVWGKVSGLIVGSGCSFYISDGSKCTDNGGKGIYVTSPFAPPSGLTNGSIVRVEGIVRIAKYRGRQIEVVRSNDIRVYR